LKSYPQIQQVIAAVNDYDFEQAMGELQILAKELKVLLDKSFL